MNAKLLAIFEQSDGSQWFFLSGLVIGFAGNLIIWALAPVPLQSNWKQLLISGGCFAVASGFFSLQGWMLKELDYIARSQGDPSPTVYALVKNRVVSASMRRLVTTPLIGLVLSGAGFALLFLTS